MTLPTPLKNSLAYQQIERALLHDTYAHAYLFVGPIKQDIHDLAFFFAQSILCPKKKIACDTCSSCLRVMMNEHPDFRYYNGAKKAISKQEIDNLQIYFAKTAVENKQNHRVCFLENMDNASLAAQNSLLKFLEEPSDGIVLILSASSKVALLDTIVSRCISIHFSHYDLCNIQPTDLLQNIQEEDIYLLSSITTNEVEIEQYKNSEEYISALKMLQEFLHNEEELLVDYHILFKPKEKEKHLLLLKLFFNFVCQIMRQSLLNSEIPLYLKKYLPLTMDDQKKADIYALMVAALDKLNKYNDPTLLFEQTIYLWRNL